MRIHLSRKSFEFVTARSLHGPFWLTLAALAASACQGSFEESDIESTAQPGLVQEQRLALSRMDLRISKYGAFGAIRHIAGDTGLSLGADERLAPVGQDAKKMFNRLRRVLLARGDETLTLRVNERITPGPTSSEGYRTLRYAQSIHGIPVIGGQVSVGIKDDGKIDVVTAAFLPDWDLPIEPRISPEEALESARRNLEGVGAIVQGSLVSEGRGTLAYHGVAPDAEKARLVWVLPASFTLEDGNDDSADVLIDAVDATYVGRASHLLHASPSVLVFTASNNSLNRSLYPNGLTPANLSTDQMAQMAREKLAKTEEAWDRSTALPLSYPPIGLVVHYGPPFSVEAVTSLIGGTRWITLGDLRFASNVLDTIAHEYGHGRFFSAIGPTSNPETRAINEAYSDISATVADRYANGLSDATFELDEGGRFGPDPKQPIRSLSNPLTSASPGQKDYYPVRYQRLDLFHENSTIVSHAFYLLAKGGQHARAGQLASMSLPPIPFVPVTPLGPELATFVFDSALRRPELFDGATMPDFALATVGVAEVLGTPIQVDAVRNAWLAVGVLGNSCTAPPGTPRLRVEDFLCAGRFRLDWDPVPGATTYFAERVQFGFPYSLATPVIDADVNTCMIQIQNSSRIHLRACNACGCSPWDVDHSLIRRPQCE
jgi:hypothetical protein